MKFQFEAKFTFFDFASAVLQRRETLNTKLVSLVKKEITVKP
jgi:hypothetical protein